MEMRARPIPYDPFLNYWMRVIGLAFSAIGFGWASGFSLGTIRGDCSVGGNFLIQSLTFLPSVRTARVTSAFEDWVETQEITCVIHE
jgi:hypothetical protein